MAERKASCSCGALTVTVEGAPDFISMCHCADCQRRSGSPFGTGAFFPRDRIKIAGSYKTWSRKTDSGNDMINYFCPNCGTNIAWDATVRPNSLAVAVGAFNDPHFNLPTISFYTANKHDWVVVPGTARQFEKGRAPPKQ